MEKEGPVRLLLKLKGQFDLAEIVTDASTAIIKPVSDLLMKKNTLSFTANFFTLWTCGTGQNL